MRRLRRFKNTTCIGAADTRAAWGGGGGGVSQQHAGGPTCGEREPACASRSRLVVIQNADRATAGVHSVERAVTVGVEGVATPLQMAGPKLGYTRRTRARGSCDRRRCAERRTCRRRGSPRPSPRPVVVPAHRDRRRDPQWFQPSGFLANGGPRTTVRTPASDMDGCRRTGGAGRATPLVDHCGRGYVN